MGKMLAHHGGGFKRGINVVDGEDEQFRLVDFRRAQHVQSGRIAEIDLVAETAHEIHLLRAHFQRREGNALHVECTGDDLADPPEAGDHHRRGRSLDTIEFALAGAIEERRQHFVVDQKQQRREQHGHGDHDDQ